MRKISFSKAMNDNPIAKIKGVKVDKLSCDNETVNDIKNEVEMRFSDINRAIHNILKENDYIDFWEGVEIWKC